MGWIGIRVEAAFGKGMEFTTRTGTVIGARVDNKGELPTLHVQDDNPQTMPDWMPKKSVWNLPADCVKILPDSL